MESVAARLRVLQSDRSLRKALRDRVRWAHLSESPTVLDLIGTLCTLREAMQGERAHPPPVNDFVSYLATIIRAEGFDPGVSAEDADRLALRLRRGCWVVEGEAPGGAIIVLGGLPWETLLPSIQAKHDEVVRANGKGLFSSLGAPTAWSFYLETLSARERERMPKVRAACEAERLVGEQAPVAPWCNNHYFAFSDGSAVSFTWRAWGDFQVAISGEGHYLDYYFG